MVFPSASLVGKPSMGALMEVRFERLCGLEEPLLRGMRIGKSCRLGFRTTMYVQSLLGIGATFTMCSVMVVFVFPTRGYV